MSIELLESESNTLHASLKTTSATERRIGRNFRAMSSRCWRPSLFRLPAQKVRRCGAASSRRLQPATFHPATSKTATPHWTRTHADSSMSATRCDDEIQTTLHCLISTSRYLPPSLPRRGPNGWKRCQRRIADRIRSVFGVF